MVEDKRSAKVFCWKDGFSNG